MHGRHILSRRRFVSAVAAATTLALPGRVLAQDATPQVMSGPIKSLTREEFEAQLVEELGYTDAATPGGSFIDSNIADIQTVHPFLVEEQVSASVVGLVYETLTGSDVRTGQPAPNALADSWEVAPDGKTYTFQLNQN